MLPRKVIVAVVIASLLLFGYGSMNEKQGVKPPNLLLGFAAVGAINALRELKELAHPF